MVAANKGSSYSDELVAHADVLANAPDEMVKAWYKANEEEVE